MLTGPWIIYENEVRIGLWEHANWVPAVGDEYVDNGRRYQVRRRIVLMVDSRFHSGKLVVRFKGEAPDLERELVDAYEVFENG